MPIIGREKSYPFPGARVKVTNPIDPDAFQPKDWGVQGTINKILGSLIDPTAHFITNNILPDDPIFFCESTEDESYGDTVAFVVSETELAVWALPPQDMTNVVWKCGEAALHTLHTLGLIIGERALSSQGILWGSLWTQAQKRTFKRDEDGDVYCIDPVGHPAKNNYAKFPERIAP